MIKLMNSAMMPQEGIYICRKIDFPTFCSLLKKAHQEKSLQSFIGYPQNIALIKKWTGIEVELNRSQTLLEDGDCMLVMKLNYRLTNPQDKGKEVNEKDFEFYFIKYKKEEKDAN